LKSLRRLLITVLFLSFTLSATASEAGLPVGASSLMAGADNEREKQGDQVLAKYMAASGRGMARGFSSVAKFVGRLPKMKKSASLAAKRHIDAGGAVEYTDVLVRAGDSTVQKDVIARFMNGEVESTTPDLSKDKDRKAVAITPVNYKFKYKGLQEIAGRQVHVYEVNPRKKRVGLFKGEIWIDSDTGLTVREAGRFVKSPSIFLKKVDFERQYAIVDGVSVPKSLSSQIQTRFWGMAELEIEYTDVTWDPELHFAGSSAF
jgi:hypothetical protein